MLAVPLSFAQRWLHGPDSVGTLLLRALCLPFALLYLLVVTARNALYDAGLLQPERVDAAVLSVGNLTVGGTGKTPLVIALAGRALAAGRRVAIVARGYGAVADAEGRTDEVALLARRLPGARVFTAPDKLLGARQAAAAGYDLVLVDDGLQARHLHRDVEVVVVDARQPFGNGWVLPAGALREPASGIARADVVVLSHHEVVDADRLEGVLNRLRAHRRDVRVLLGSHVPRGVRCVGGGPESPPALLAGREVFLFCGIASPEGFQQTVEALGARVLGILPFPDHHAFDGADLAAVRARARTAQLVCTEKDALKVAAIAGNDDVLCLTIDMDLQGEIALPKKPEPAAHEHAHH